MDNCLIDLKFHIVESTQIFHIKIDKTKLIVLGF